MEEDITFQIKGRAIFLELWGYFDLVGSWLARTSNVMIQERSIFPYNMSYADVICRAGDINFSTSN